jgi:hypothetical protein
MHTKPWVRARAIKNYWDGIEPASGRPYSSALSEPDDWNVTQGHKLLSQHTRATTEEEMIFKFVEELFVEEI